MTDSRTSQSPQKDGDLTKDFDYAHVDTVARIAVYDDMRAAPRIIEIQPNTTAEFIEDLASTIYTQAQMKGGTIPYTAIREVSENFIHAQFAEIVVSILDQGNTIRFADQGPGIKNKEKAQLPGFSSAIEPMKEYIRGVGSGLPIVKEYLNFSQGTITIEDNLVAGSVVTLSIGRHDEDAPTTEVIATPQPAPQLHDEKAVSYISLSDREKEFLLQFDKHDELGVTDLVKLTGAPPSSTHVALKKLEEKDLVVQTKGKKRRLTKNGAEIARTL